MWKRLHLAAVGEDAVDRSGVQNIWNEVTKDMDHVPQGLSCIIKETTPSVR